MLNLIISAAVLIILISLVASPVVTFFLWKRIRNLEAKFQLLEGGISTAVAAVDKRSKASSEIPENTVTADAAAPSESEQIGTNEEAKLQPAVERPSTATQQSTTNVEADKPRRRSLEQRLGASWAVWIGGLALVLGGIFLVRYTIEADLIGPAARVTLGALLSGAMIGFAEWLRRRTTGQPNRFAGEAYIPGILTLAGTTTAFATVFAAHSLYEFLGSTSAFIAFGVVAIATLVAAVLHGPGVASYGLIACYVVPFLVNSQNPSIVPLVFYGLFVSAAAYSVARIRLWRWFAISAVAGSLFWGHFLALAARFDNSGFVAVYDIGALLMTAYVFLGSLYPRNATLAHSRTDWLAVVVVGLHTLLFFYLLQLESFSTFSLVVTCLVCIGLLILASEWPVASPLAYVAAGFALLTYLSFEVDLHPQDINTRAPLLFPRIVSAFSNPDAVRLLTFGSILTLSATLLGFAGAIRSTGRTALATASIVVPIGIVIVSYFRVTEFETNLFFGILSFVFAIAFVFAHSFLERNLTDPNTPVTGMLAAYSIGTVAAIATGLSIMLEHGWLTISLAITTVGVAGVGYYKRLVELPWVTVATAALCMASIAYQPTIVSEEELGTTPVLNWLLVGYGLPAVAFGCSAWLFSNIDRNLPQRILSSLSVLMSLLTGIVLVHHAMNPGDFYAPADTLAERSLITLVFLAGSLSLQGLDIRSRDIVFEYGSILLGLLSFVLMAKDHLYNYNPYITGELVGDGYFFNLNLMGYLLPALVVGTIAALSRNRKPIWYTWSAGVVSILFVFSYLTIQTRTMFHGTDLHFGPTGDTELYAYSAVWLILGILLLIAGFATRIQALRLASAVLVIVAILKVFLFDMSSLEGILRALSFLGLGLVLIGTGLIYQRLLRTQSNLGDQSLNAKLD